MIVNTGWLLDYLSPRPPLADLLAVLPRAGLDVEAVLVLARELEPVRIGFLRKKEPLPEVSGYYVCDVDVGERRQIVCASEHPLEIGWGVPVAPAGIDLPTGIPIREEHFHGVLSQGMICLDGELGMTALGTGLQVFRDEAVLGKRLTEVIEVSEALVHMKVPPNRPDCLGLIGIAREVAAMLDLRLVLPEAPLRVALNEPVVAVDILDPDRCGRYSCQLISGIEVAKSPPWLHSRLLATGSRPISNAVDITNFVLKEWGHPLHAFDLAKVRERVVVRRFRPGETLELLDGRMVSADGEPLAIADNVAPMALAGVMGGRASSITPATTDVLLEAAYFEPTGIRRTSRSLGLSTDASYRFERGADPNETLDAARDRAASLLLSVAKGKSAGPVSDNYASKANRRVFSLSPERASSYLGISLTRERILASLEKLGHRCSEDLKKIEVPTRRVDVNDPVVLIEDVARVVGYDAIEAAPSAELPTPGGRTALDAVRETARGVLTGAGYLEIRGVPLEPAGDVDEFSQLEGQPIVLTNPLIVDLGQMRRSLVPSLLNTAAQNARRHSTTFRYFEIDKTFSVREGTPDEHWAIAILLGGALNDFDWSTRREADFFDLKGTVESLLAKLCCPQVSFLPASLSGYANGTAARIVVRDSTIGVMGQVSPEILAARKIHSLLFGAEMFLGNLIAGTTASAVFEPLARFPAVFRDLSFVVKRDIRYAEIEQAILAAAGPQLESVNCIDVFEGKGISKNSRSLAVSLVFRAADRTLESEEVTTCVDRVISHLRDSLQAELRS